MIFRKQFLLFFISVLLVSSLSNNSNASTTISLSKESLTSTIEPSIQDSLSSSEFVDITAILKSRTLEYTPDSEPEIRKPSLTPSIQVVGDFELFYVYSNPGYDQINTTLKAIGEHCYIYVANSYSMTAGEIANFMDEFDTIIYPEETSFFGDTDGTLGDIDGDQKITLLFYHIPFAAGYFDSIHEHPINYFTGYEYKECSNEREMVFLRKDGFSTLAHEFNHLIHYNIDQTEDRFLDEAFAQMGEWITGYLPSDNRTGFVSYFENYSNDSLLMWDYDSEDHDARVDYGGAYLFIFYCVEQFGIEILEPLMSSQEDGATSIENTLADLGYSITFETLFTNWYLAMRLDDPTLGDGEWGYRWLDVTLYDKVFITSAPTNVTIKEFEWSGSFYHFNIESSNEQSINITAPSDANYQLVFLPYEDGLLPPYDSVWISSGNSYQVNDDQWNQTDRFEMLVLSIPNNLTGDFGIGDLLIGSFELEAVFYSVSTGDFNYNLQYFSLENVEIRYNDSLVLPESISEVSIHFFDELDTEQVFLTVDLVYDEENQSWRLSENITLEYLSHGLNYYKIYVIHNEDHWWSAKSTTFEIVHEMLLESLSISSTSETLNTYYVKSSFNFTYPLWEDYLDDLTVEVEFFEDGSASPFEIKTAYYSSDEGVWITSITLTSDMDPIYVVINASITIAGDSFSLEVTSSPIDLEYYPPSDPPTDEPSDSSLSEFNLASLGIIMISMVSLVFIRRFSNRKKL
ncbi:MAG: hypothetical protein KAR35_00930 [Candidatus Heimdallarchaeota archaeon]|nr:hypothetical protein [Candidatus Heimdallarchaeota archaeon]MCK5047917.1 hypothetical protein [Candidatus Heimdallarchaeota archaeon]